MYCLDIVLTFSYSGSSRILGSDKKQNYIEAVSRGNDSLLVSGMYNIYTCYIRIIIIV